MKKNGGGPIYPSKETYFIDSEPNQYDQGKTTKIAREYEHLGMTLRQYYASMAMQAMLTNGTFLQSYTEGVKEFFRWADAMIAFEENEK